MPWGNEGTTLWTLRFSNFPPFFSKRRVARRASGVHDSRNDEARIGSTLAARDRPRRNSRVTQGEKGRD